MFVTAFMAMLDLGNQHARTSLQRGTYQSVFLLSRDADAVELTGGRGGRALGFRPDAGYATATGRALHGAQALFRIYRWHHRERREHRG